MRLETAVGVGAAMGTPNVDEQFLTASLSEREVRVLQCVAVCCGVLRCVAECCNVLQCATMCCRVLRCVAG